MWLFYIVPDQANLLFLVVFCLTIGYGDITPESQGGRVFFVIYSIAAVPLIASFVVRKSSSSLNH